eukprot:TRINITY_DN6331_c0_g2_i1.p1 TRINITY_DN6331_c0_g2~~TRINITY_DN6331_c0_g2_i1.p1  ORF type:complete len:122 (+),score=13.78 TRINITY_DN6331_c0_g2_i1:954-1319(+)
MRQDTAIIDFREFVRPDETAATFLLRFQVERICTSVPFLDEQSLSTRHVVEINGPSGSAKTEILIQTTAATLLPAMAPDGVDYRGAGACVRYFDLDGRFDVLRLRAVLASRILRARRRCCS